MKFKHYINDKLIDDNIIKLIKEEKNSKNYEFLLDNIYNYIYITDRLIFIRENDEYKINIEIGNENKCNIFLKDKNLSLDVDVNEAVFNISDNEIVFEYILDTDNDKHKIVLETEE